MADERHNSNIIPAKCIIPPLVFESVVEVFQHSFFRKRFSSSFRGFLSLFVIILILNAPFPVWADKASNIDLTPKEQAWLAEHPEIVLGAPTDYPPMVIKKADGTYVGVLVDLFEQTNQALDARIRLHIEDSWADIQQKAQNREIDGLAFGGRDPSRDTLYNATDLVLTTYFSVFARSQNEFRLTGFSDLGGMRIGYKRAARPTRSLLEKLPASTIIKPYDSHESMTQALLSREIDVIVAWMSYDHWRKDKMQGTIDNILLIDEYPIEMVTHVRKDWPELVPILNKAIAAIRQDQLPRIVDKWFGQWPLLSEGTSVSLTHEEQAWLNHDHAVQVRVTDHVPYLYLKDGQPVGIAVDLLKIVSQRTGAKFNFVNPSPPFSRDLKGIIQHTGPDLIASLMPTPAREKSILFTEPYITSPRFIFIRDDSAFIASINDLNGKKVAVVKDYDVQRDLIENYPNIDLLVFSNNKEALEGVSSGKAFAFIGDLVSTPAMINEFGFRNLKAACPSGLDDHRLGMGIRSDWPELKGIISKVFEAIPASKKASIINSWSTVKLEHGIRLSDVIKWGLLLMVSALGIIFMFVIWNRTLKQKVTERTFELSESEARFRSTFEQAAVGVAQVNFEGEFLRINRKFCDIVGYSEGEMLDLTFQEITHPDDLEVDLEYIEKLLKGKIENYSMEKRYFRKDGSIVWINLTVSLLSDIGGIPQYFVAVIKDISDRKQAEDALQLSHDFQEHLNTTVPDAVFSVKMPERVIEWANDSYGVLGYEPEECVGKSPAMLYTTPDESRAVVSLLLDVIREGKDVLRTEAMLRHKNGRVFPAELHGAVYKENGEVVSVTALVRDISERKVKEQELQDAKIDYRMVADYTYNWEWWLNPDGTFRYVSPACERISGYKADQYMENPALVSEIIVPEDRHIWDEHGHESEKDIEYREIQFRIKQPDGEVRWIEHTCQPVFTRENNFLGFRASNRDITDHKQAELDLNNSLVEINRLKDLYEKESMYLREEIKLEHNFDDIIGQSEVLKYVLHRVEQVAHLDSIVLILGETGTGKELIARSLHKLSARSKRPLVKVNCAALPGELIESELFGREKGAFTGATMTQIGRFELANGSTLFLDEIGELPLELQSKLLRVIESGEFERLGSSRTLKSDARIITATNRNLEEEGRSKRFREDLLYRLKIFPITIPPLRDRLEDIPLMVEKFVQVFSRKMGKTGPFNITNSSMQMLMEYSWPGNVRELMHIVESALITLQGNKLIFDIPKTDDTPRITFRSFEEMEREYILEVLTASDWKVGGENSAASILRMPPSTLRSRIKKLGLKRP